MVTTRQQQKMLATECKKRCMKHTELPLTKLHLSDMCVKDIYAYIRAYGCKPQLKMLASLGSRPKRSDLCRIYKKK